MKYFIPNIINISYNIIVTFRKLDISKIIVIVKQSFSHYSRIFLYLWLLPVITARFLYETLIRLCLMYLLCI